MSERGTSPTDPKLVAALRNYLPSSLERQCLLGDEVKHPSVCVEHMAALLRTVSTYLPRQVVVPLLADPEPGKVEGGFTYGTVMFADISGFTAMSEKLSQLGTEGAEIVTGIINRLFTALLKVADHYGGDLLKFGGDALLVFFGDESHTLSACVAALRMQETMSQFSETITSQGTFRLQMSVGLGTGPLFMASLGSEESMEFAVMGQAMTQMAQAESRASAGEIFIDTETYHKLDEIITGQAITREMPEGFYQLLGFQKGDIPELSVAPENPLDHLPLPPIRGDTLSWIADTVRRIQALALFLPPGLMDKIKLEPERIAIGGEYRPVTVFFANFYGINEIIEELKRAHGAEHAGSEITAILNAHFTAMRSVIAKYGGVVNKVDTYAVGHRIMTLFGAPRAHIDDPERAVRAALEMQEAMAAFAELNTSCGSFSLKQRIGINTGLVFAGNVGSLTHQEYSVMGDGVNLAARLMGVATDGQVIISQSTARQSEGAFLFHEQKSVRVKGKSLPVHNYQVMGLQERRARERRPLIGRDDEWKAIHTLTDQSLGGETRALTLVGDAGLGKSRLLDEVTTHWIEEHSALSLSATCPSFGRHTPYLPWLDLLRALFGFNPADSDQVKLEKIEVLLQEIDTTWRDWTELIGRLLGLDVQETDWVHALDAQTRQRMTFLIISGLVAHVANEQPLLLSIDDLQWADDTSVELVNHVARQATGRPLLVVLAYRPEESLEAIFKIADLSYHTGLRLQELSSEASLRLLDTLLPTTPQMPEQLKELILKNAQGNPLFIEEVARSLIENYLTLDEKTGTYHARTDLEDIEVPDSVNRVIMSRMDRLDESSRNVLKVASVIGQEFEHWLLGDIYPYRRAQGELRERLDELSHREILDGSHSESLYLFRHILTREVAYESMLYADRRQLHRSIGDSIEAQQAGRLTEYGEVLAYHYGLAEEWNKALYYHLQAGRKAQSIYANEDAIHHFRQALKAVEQVPYSEGHQLEIHERLGETLDTLGDYDEALIHIHHAQDLVMQVNYSPEENARRLADLCRKIAIIYEKKSDYETAFDWLSGGLIAIKGIETIEVAHIYLLGAGVYRRQGKNEDAITWCQKSLAVASQIQTRESQQAMARAYYNLGGIYTRQGDLVSGVEFCHKSLQIALQINDIVIQSTAHLNLANAYFYQGDWPKATEQYLRALEITRKIGDVYRQAMITLNLGGVYLNQGDLDQGASYYQQSLEMWQELGSTYMIAVLHNNMGEGALRRGDPNQALHLLQKSLEMFQQIGSGDFMSEVYRHMAMAHLYQAELDKALHCAQHSLELAQEQEMRLEEGSTRRVLGQVHLAHQELAQAERELHASLRTLKELNSRYEMGKTFFQLARLHQIRGEQEQMRENQSQALAIFEELGARLDLAQAQKLKAK
ncbi:MAG: tetratricopeptide repeat protein [Chloroflexi bacterium]|nr:tetratricopeptide repeat protein [Chloroflexota bacterium]